jgi:epoxyqueuosine reductase
VRNALIAAGNSSEAGLLADVRPLLDDASPLVRAAAIWALRRLASANDCDRERRRRLELETDADVLAEWL